MFRLTTLDITHFWEININYRIDGSNYWLRIKNKIEKDQTIITWFV